MRWRGIKSQNQLARISGVPQSCIHRILNRGDHYWPDRRTVLRLAEALDTSAVWLTDGVAPPPDPVIARPRRMCCKTRPSRATAMHRDLRAVAQPPRRHQKQVLTVVRILLDGRPAN